MSMISAFGFIYKLYFNEVGMENINLDVLRIPFYL